ncbi:MAG: class I SAM-dependent RNA methyltransferase [Verrucomicrobia bacterium]|nr:class I SAM-dependent RNA methyltransferase [Verrucomicrobiota bacterium]
MSSIHCQIEAIAFGGDGVAHLPKTIFIPFTAPGDHIEARITEEKPRFARGEMTKLIQAGPDRTTPRCPYYGRCGGCQLQHLSYEAQLKAKKQFIIDSLQRIAGQSPEVEIIGATQQWEYRRHITLHTDGKNIGFYAKDNKTLLDIDQCPLYGTPFEKRAGRQMKSAHVELLGLQLEASSEAFVQAHSEMAQKLYQALVLLASNFPAALDLYCGIGSTTLLLARQGLQVHGVDTNQSAITLAQKNAQLNGLKATFSCSDAAKALPTKAPLVICNPPRTGLHFYGPFPDDILYISCMPPTLARDISRLKGYKIQSVQAFDLFPQTTHVETLIHLRK